MSRRGNQHTAVQEKLDQAAAQVTETPEVLKSPDFMHTAVAGLIGGCGGDPYRALEHTALEAVRARAERDQLLALVKTYQAQLSEQPRLSRVLSLPFEFGTNGDRRRMIYVSPPGRESMLECVCLAEPDQMPPAPLGFCYTDAGGKFYLAPAPHLPAVQLQEHSVIRVDLESEFPEVGRVVVNQGPDQHSVLLADRGLVDAIHGHLEEGEGVIVRHDSMVVREIVESSVKTPEDWLEIPPLDGPALDDLVFPGWLEGEWKRDVHYMRQRRPLRVLLIGPTGTGKTEAVLRAGRQAALADGRELAIIRMSAPYIGSSYYSETERTIRRAVKRAERLAQQGYVAVILIDEADALLGNSEHRYEGSVDRRVRLAFQELLSGDVAGVSIYLTMNPRSDSWLPAAIDRRFRKRRYPRTRRRQMARICAGYARPGMLKRLGLTASEFGNRVADFVYANGFVVARALMHSGRAMPVRARDLHDCSPGALEDVLVSYGHDVEDAMVDSLDALWIRLDREFRSVALNEANLFEMSFLARPDHDTVKKVEPVGPGDATAPPVMIA